MATINHEKVSMNIPHDLFFNILSKLPIKSLKRFSCVTPSWVDLFEDPNFITMYQTNFLCNNDHDTSIFLRQTMPNTIDDNAFMLYGERFENKVKLDWPQAIQDDDNKSILILGSIINGIVCLYNAHNHGPQIVQKVVLWNLSSNEFKVIPTGYVQCPLGNEIIVSLHGFGYDNFTNDYKLIRQLHFCKDPFWNGDIEDPPISTCQLYSLKNNSWKKLNVEVPNDSSYDELYLNGMCHWSGYNKYKELMLVSFNLSDEVFYTTPIDLNDCYARWSITLMVMNDSIGMIKMHECSTCFDISILGELGVRESWTKIFINGSLPCASRPFEVWNRGKIFFRKDDDGEIYWFELSTQMIEEIGVKDDEGPNSQIGIYKESLLGIGWINS